MEDMGVILPLRMTVPASPPFVLCVEFCVSKCQGVKSVMQDTFDTSTLLTLHLYLRLSQHQRQ